MQRLGIDRQAVGARFGHRLHAFACRGMDEVDAGAGGRAKGNRAPKRELLGELAVDVMQVPSRGQLLGFEALVVELHKVVVLGMHHHDSVVRRDLLHRKLDAAEVEPEARAFGIWWQKFGGENLEARKTLLDSLGQLVESRKRQRAADRDVKRIVNVRVAFPSLETPLDRALHVGLRMHPREIDMRGGPAEGHPASVFFGAERVEPRLGAHREAIAEMGVRLDSAGHGDFAGGVDRAGGLDTLVGERDERDFFSNDADVPFAGAAGRHDLCATNDQVEHDFPRRRRGRRQDKINTTFAISRKTNRRAARAEAGRDRRALQMPPNPLPTLTLHCWR